LVRWLGTSILAFGAFALALAALSWPIEATLAQWLEEDSEDVAAIVVATARAGAAAALVGYAVVRSRFGRRLDAATALFGLVLAVGLGVLGALAGRAVVKTSAEIARAVESEYREGDLVVLYRRLWQGVPFYLRRRVGMIRNFDEVWHGVSISPEREEFYWEDLTPLVHRWSSGRRVFVLTDGERVPEIARVVAGEPRVLARDRRRVVVVNYPPVGDGEGTSGTLPVQEGAR